MLLSGISVLSCSYPCTNVTILRNNPTDALTYVNTPLYTVTLLRVSAFIWGHREGLKVKGKGHFWVLQHCCLEAYCTLTRMSSFISRGAAHTKRRDRPLLAKEGTIPEI